MGLTDFLQHIPGFSKLNIKFAIEGFSSHIIKHVGHKVDNYRATINFKTKFVEFLIYHPGPDVPDFYKAPKNQTFKGQQRNIPENSRLYDMEIGGALDTIESILTMQLPDFKGTVDFIILFVDRNSKEVPVEIYFENEGVKSKLKHVLK